MLGNVIAIITFTSYLKAVDGKKRKGGDDGMSYQKKDGKKQ